MARRKNESQRVDLSAFDQAGARVIDNPLTTEVEDSYLEYAYSVIHSRALPDARDGLKPVHRRILWSMYEQGHRPDRPYVKSARVVGDCFVRGTLVSTPEGLRPIETFDVGDLVHDPDGRAVGVTAVYENPGSSLIRVRWTNGHTMTVTPGQRFRVLTDDHATEWVEAENLPGRLVVTASPPRSAAVQPGSDMPYAYAYAYVRGLVVASGFALDRGNAAGRRIRIRMRDTEPLDFAHGWAVESGLNVSRGKRKGAKPTHRDQHILTFAPHDGLIEAGAAPRDQRCVPSDVLADRGAWLPFLAGFLDGAGQVRRTRPEIVLVGTGRRLLGQLYAMAADLGVVAHYSTSGRNSGHKPSSGLSMSGLSMSGGDARALAEAILQFARTGAKRDGLHSILEAPSSGPVACSRPGFLGVESVERVPDDTTYDIQIGSEEHAFVAEGSVVHNCMGKYHPHGDVAIYDAMVRLAQDFSLNAPLIDGHGNFGSPDDGPAASRYCVTGDTRVRLADESSARIADLADLEPDSEAEVDFEVLDKDGKAVRADRVFHSGVHPTLRITTRSGFSLRGTENHPVLCLEAPMGVPMFQWRRLDEIKPGTVVCIARNAWTEVVPTAQESMLGILAGAWASEGWANETRAGFDNTDEHFFAEVLHAYDHIVGGRRYVAERKTRVDRKTVRELDIQDYAGGMDAFRASPLAEFIGHKAIDKMVPEFVWRGGPGVKRAFLMAVFEGDGGPRVSLDGFTVQYSTYSDTLARGIQELLAEFGVIATRRSYTRASGAVEHRLVVSGLRNVRAFAQRVGFLRTKQAKIVNLLRRSSLRAHRLSSDRVPFVADYVRGALDFDRRGSGRKWLTQHNFDRVERWETERLRIIDRIKDAEVLATILPIMDAGYRYEEVTSVETCAPAEVYSVRVRSEDHSFLAGGFVNHNTEARMSNEAMLLVEELGEGTVDFKPTYDGDAREPKVLPAAFPNLLVNGTSGIAVGMATNMIPHNLGEVVAAARHLITNPEADLDDLMRFVPGPDLPTGGQLLGLDEVRRAYETGRGVVRMRARAQTGPLEGGRGRQAITVTELPYGVGTEKIIEAITDEVKGKPITTGPKRGQRQAARLQGIADVKDLTDREHGTRLVIECKVGVNPQALLADLYRLTPLESSFGINNLVLVDGQPRTLGLKALLEVFVQHRYDVVTRRTEFRRSKRQDRLHLVDGLLIALIDIDRVVAIIRSSDDVAAARASLTAEFSLTEIQANYILDTPLRRLTRFDRIELETEQARLRDEIAELSRILDNDDVLKQVVSDELARVAADFGAARRTTLIDGDLKEVLAASAPAGPLEVADDPCQVILSATGLIARTAAESEEATEARRRSGRVKHDAVRAVVHSTARGRILLVTSRGRAFKTDVLPLPVLPEQIGTVSIRGGMSASELVPLEPGERVVGLAPVAAGDSPGIAMGTKHGVVKVCAPEWPVRSDEFEVITLKEGDEVLQATFLSGGAESLVFVTSDASLLRFPAKLVRPQGLKGGGMAGINLSPDAEVISFNVVVTADDTHGEPMVVTSTGTQVKVSPFASYPAKGRATGGVRVHRFLKGESRLAVAWVGPRPVGATTTGDPVELPEPDARRDGSGAAVIMGPQIIGHLIERG